MAADFSLLKFGDGLNDWLNLLQGPTEPIFAAKTTFPEGWKYLLRLIMLVLIMLVAVLTLSYLGKGISSDGTDLASFAANTALQTQYTIIVILAGALFAAIYSFTMAPLFKIDINIRQSFFTLLFTLLPWIPIVLLVWALVYLLPTKLPLLTFFIVIFIVIAFPIIAIIQFSRGVTVVSGCPRLKCTASIAIPAALFFILVIWIWIKMPEATLAPPDPADSVSLLAS